MTTKMILSASAVLAENRQLGVAVPIPVARLLLGRLQNLRSALEAGHVSPRADAYSLALAVPSTGPWREQPDLIALLRNPERVGEVPRERIADLLAQVGAVQTVLVAQLLTEPVRVHDDVRAAAVQEPLLTADDLSEILKVPKTRVYELIRRGEIHSVRMGKRHVRVTRAELNAYVDRRSVNFANPPPRRRPTASVPTLRHEGG